MEPVAPPESNDKERPAWIVPAAGGVVAVLLIVIGFIVVRGDGSTEIAGVTAPSSTSVATSTAATSSIASTLPSTTAPTTVPASTAATSTAPATTAAGSTTTPVLGTVTTTPPPTTTVGSPTTTVTAATTTTTRPDLAPTGPVAADVATLSPGQASVATDNGVVVLDEVASCRVTAAVGFNVYSYLLTGDRQLGAVLLEIGIDEGGDPFVVLSEMVGEIEGFDGQDSVGSYWSGPLPGALNEPVNQLALEPSGGLATGPANVSFDFVSDTEGCATGLLGEPWPFSVGEDPELLDPFDGSLTSSYQFSVLGECENFDNTLLLSEGGILAWFETDGELIPTIQLFSQADQPLLVSRYEPGPNETLIDQQGGGGDVTYVARVSAFDGGDVRYLSWTQPPAGVEGGLPLVRC